MTAYKLLALTSLLSAQSTAARKISTKGHLRKETATENNRIFHRFLNADESMSVAATVDAIAAEKQEPAVSSKSAKSAKPIDVLTVRVDALEKEQEDQELRIDSLEKEQVEQEMRFDTFEKEQELRFDALEKELERVEDQTNTHPVAPSCVDNLGRINDLAAGLPDGCKLEEFESIDAKYRLVCDEPGTYNLHLPDMCNASAMLVAGGGSGGNGNLGKGRFEDQLSGGGGAGGVVLYEDTSFGDGYYLVSVGAGGIGNPEGTRGNGGDTSFELKQKLSQTPTEYPGQELLAFGGGRGGGVFLFIERGNDLPCVFPTAGGSGGGGTPFNEGLCNYNDEQNGAVSLGSNQGNAGGDASNFCGGGGGGAGEPGDDASAPKECVDNKGGDGIDVGGIFGKDYGYPGGWFGGGGNPGVSEQNRTLGGGGARGNKDDGTLTVKNAIVNTGGGGMGCKGSFFTGIANETCNLAIYPDPEGDLENPQYAAWGGDGGSGILFIVFDVCPCSDDGN